MVAVSSGSFRVEAVPLVELSADPVALGQALAENPDWVAGGAFESQAGPVSTGIVSGPVAGMPTNGAAAVLLSTGDAREITAPNDSGSTGSALGGGRSRGTRTST